MSVRFKNKRLFGTTFDAYNTKAMGHVMRLLMDDRITSDGAVNGGSLSELWSYIYVLFINNKHNSVFASFSGVKGPLKSKGTAKRFIRGVLEETGANHINSDILMSFINSVVKIPEINNPVAKLICSAKDSKSSLSSVEPKISSMSSAKAIVNSVKPKISSIEPKISSVESKISSMSSAKSIVNSAKSIVNSLSSVKPTVSSVESETSSVKPETSSAKGSKYTKYTKYTKYKVSSPQQKTPVVFLEPISYVKTKGNFAKGSKYKVNESSANKSPVSVSNVFLDSSSSSKPKVSVKSLEDSAKSWQRGKKKNVKMFV